MREKLETLPMTELREIAKANGIKSVTVMRKSALIDRILEVTGGNTITSENTPKPHTERTYVPVLPVLTKSLYKRLQNLLRKPLSQKQHISTRIRRHQNRIPSTSHSTAALWQMGFLK